MDNKSDWDELEQWNQSRIENEKESGKYLLKVKNKDIQFTAIKNYGTLSEDFSDRSHKYYFELWDSEEKNDFTVNEKIENGV